MRRRSMSTTRIASVVIFVAMGLFIAVERTLAQTTEFTYQGNLTNAGSPANGNFDFEFRVFDAPTGGAQIPNFEVVRSNVPVVNGLFTVTLDFSNSFSGTDRWLEIRVRTAGGGGFTILDPRQKLGRTPYAIQSLTATNAVNALNATNAQNAVNATNAENANTAQNALQLGGVAADQFVVTTDPRMTNARPPTPGSANYIQNTTTQQTSTDFNISGTGQAGILRANTQFNIGFNGVLRVGGDAMSPWSSTYLGVWAGENSSSSANLNSFFGWRSGRSHTTSAFNSFFGAESGENATGQSNSYFGLAAGKAGTTGNRNSFFGVSTGLSNITGSNNTLVGSAADVGAGNLTFATAIGSLSVASLSNSIYLGRPGGEDTVRIPGAIVVTGTTSLNNNLAVAGGASAVFTGAVFIPGIPGGGGTTTLCRNGTNQLSLCSSSARYKEDIYAYSSGLDLLKKLRPVSFNWKSGGMADLGLVAEDVAAIEPLLATYNEKGEIEGVKYDRIGVVLVNAVKEQQAEIESLRARVDAQKAELSALKTLVCAANPGAATCKEEK